MFYDVFQWVFLVYIAICPAFVSSGLGMVTCGIFVILSSNNSNKDTSDTSIKEWLISRCFSWFLKMISHQARNYKEVAGIFRGGLARLWIWSCSNEIQLAKLWPSLFPSLGIHRVPPWPLALAGGGDSIQRKLFSSLTFVELFRLPEGFTFFWGSDVAPFLPRKPVIWHPKCVDWENCTSQMEIQEFFQMIDPDRYMSHGKNPGWLGYI